MNRHAPRKDRHTISLLSDHIVFTPKYRGAVLTGAVARMCEREIRRTCRKLDVDILDLSVCSDHVHLFVRYPPKLSASLLAEKIKSNTSRELRRRFSHLVKWCSQALWAPGCYHGSVGQGLDVVQQYVRAQKQG
ncbi:MAG: IS200/IS605 family transposase [Candidatus Thermoplasmatota archaeon]